MNMLVLPSSGRRNGDHMEFIDGGVNAAQGFRAAAVCAGFKKGRKDMAMITSDVPFQVAGTFTTNLVKAAPVIWDKQIVDQTGKGQAVVMNSGYANACTGREGDKACRLTAEAAAASLGIRPDMVLLASTGVIGMPLPIDKIKEGIEEMVPLLSQTRGAGSAAAEGIMTTDTVKKEACVTFELGGKKVILGGMTKGAGMIHPQMGTMLCFLTTDACIDHRLMQKALLSAVQDSFNMISVDGDMSTNDTCLLMANGLAGNERIASEDEDYQVFADAVRKITQKLARAMAKDGEGAHALFEVKVKGACSKEQAKVLAKSVIESSLVKTAIAGHDANWGRIICAMGYSGAAFDQDKVDLDFISRAGTISIARAGVTTGFDEDLATKILSEDEITALIDLHEGDAEATAWGCDLTHEYITINADYRS